MLEIDLICGQIVREGGLIGSVNVTWRVQSSSNNDLMENEGQVHFESGQQEADLEIRIRGDTIPEVDKGLTILLVGTSAVSEGCLIIQIMTLNI